MELKRLLKLLSRVRLIVVKCSVHSRSVSLV